MSDIIGHNTLTEDELVAINEIKELAIKCGEAVEKLESEGQLLQIDKRSLSLAKTNLQQGFMWATRAIAKPTTF